MRAGAILIAIDMRSPSPVLRYGSIAAGVVSATLIVANHFFILNPLFTDESTGRIPLFNLFFLAYLLPALAAGALALYLRQKEHFGRLGRAGFYLTFGGFAFAAIGGLAIIVVGLSVGEEATLGVLDVLAHPLSMLLYSFGSVLFGIATFQASVLPRAGALLLAIGAPLWFFGPAFFSSLIDGSEDWILALPAMAPAALFGGGWALLGHALRSEIGERSAHPRPACARIP